MSSRKDSLEWLRSSLRTPLVRDSAFLLATSALGNGLGFLFWLAVARSYPAATVGLGASVYSAILFLAAAGTIGLPYGIIRFLPTEENKAGLLNAAFLASAVASAILGIVFLSGLDLWAPGLVVLRVDPTLATICLFSVVGFSLGIVLDTAFVASRRANYGTFRTVVFGVMRLPIPILLAGLLGLLGILLSWIVALVVSLAAGAVLLLPRIVPEYRPAMTLDGIRRRGIVAYSLWNHAAVIVAAIPLSLLPVLVLNTPGPRGGAEPSAYFFAALATASLLYVVPGSFATSLFVEGSHPGTNYSRGVRTATGFSAAFLTGGILCVVLLGSWVLRLFGEDYARESYETLVLLALTSPLVLANTLLTTHLRITKRLRPLFGISVASSAATLVLAYVLLHALGIWGAGLGFVLGQTLSFVLLLGERWVHRAVGIGESM